MRKLVANNLNFIFSFIYAFIFYIQLVTGKMMPIFKHFCNLPIFFINIVKYGRLSISLERQPSNIEAIFYAILTLASFWIFSIYTQKSLDKLYKKLTYKRIT